MLKAVYCLKVYCLRESIYAAFLSAGLFQAAAAAIDGFLKKKIGGCIKRVNILKKIEQFNQDNGPSPHTPSRFSSFPFFFVLRVLPSVLFFDEVFRVISFFFQTKFLAFRPSSVRIEPGRFSSQVSAGLPSCCIRR